MTLTNCSLWKLIQKLALWGSAIIFVREQGVNIRPRNHIEGIYLSGFWFVKMRMSMFDLINNFRVYFISRIFNNSVCSSLMYSLLEWAGTGWSKQRANDRYKDHLGGQLTQHLLPSQGWLWLPSDRLRSQRMYSKVCHRRSIPTVPIWNTNASVIDTA